VVEHFNEAQWPNTPWGGVVTAAYHRPRDVSFALTRILERNATPGEPIFRTIDPRHVVAAGHSLGGYTAWVLLGGDDDICDASGFLDGISDAEIAAYCTSSPPDPRFAAVFTLDGTSWALRFEELARVRGPSLVMGQAAFTDAPPDPAWPDDATFVARPHAAMAARGRSVRVDVVGTDHMAFSNPCDGFAVIQAQGGLSDADFAALEAYNSWWCSDSQTADVRRRITKYVVAFLDTQAQGRGEGGARRVLTQADVLAHEPGIELYWEERCCGEPPLATPASTTFTYHKDMRPRACLVGVRNPPAYFP
jgi:hypothetical protein